MILPRDVEVKRQFISYVQQSFNVLYYIAIVLLYIHIYNLGTVLLSVCDAWELLLLQLSI